MDGTVRDLVASDYVLAFFVASSITLVYIISLIDIDEDRDDD
jgi:hypothetical protein